MRRIIIIFAAALQAANAHYCFDRFIVNNTLTEPWQYVRNVTKGPDIYGVPDLPIHQENPQLDVTSDNMRCGRNASISGWESDVATVKAGDLVGFRGNAEPGRWIYHPGPGLVYLSKAPASMDVRDYDGSGDWFKIFEAGLNITHAELPGHESEAHWLLQGKRDFMFYIPKLTPPGQYLLRVEHIYPWPTWNRTQFFINCAQVNVVGSREAALVPGPTVKFPGAYSSDDPAIHISQDLWESGAGRPAPNYDPHEYKAPGPAVWNGWADK